MTHPSKVKGNNYERELVAQARDKGLESERAYASNGRSLGESEEVDLIISGCRVQAKRRKALPAWRSRAAIARSGTPPHYTRRYGAAAS